MRWVTLDGAAADQPKLEITYTSTIEGPALTDSLEAYWNGSDLLDKTGNGHDLTNNNAVTHVPGKIGNAYHLVRASSQFLTNNDAELKPAGNADWTFACWVKLAANTEFYTVAAQHTPAAPTGGAGWRLFYHDIDTGLDFYVAQLDDDAGSAEVADTVGFGGSPVVGAYDFVAVRHDAARKFFHVFFNNATPTSASRHDSGEQWGPYVDAAIQSAAAFALGRFNASTPQYMDGDVDEAGFWTRWLSNSELATLFNNGDGKTFNGTAFVDGGSVRAARGLTLLGAG
jgi:hypothetical protein